MGLKQHGHVAILGVMLRMLQESPDCALSSSASDGLKQRWNQLEQSFRNLRPAARRSGVGLARAPPTPLPAQPRPDSAGGQSAASDAHPVDAPTAAVTAQLDRRDRRFGRSSLGASSPPTAAIARHNSEPALSHTPTLPCSAVQADFSVSCHAASEVDQATPPFLFGASSDTVSESCRPKRLEQESRDAGQSPSQGALQRLTQRLQNVEEGIQKQRLRELEHGIRQALRGAYGWREETVFGEDGGSVPVDSVPTLVKFLQWIVSENESLRKRESALSADLRNAQDEARDAAEKVDLQVRDLIEQIERLRGEWAERGVCSKCASSLRSKTEEAASYSSGQSTVYTEQIFDADDELGSCSAEGSCDIESHCTRTDVALQQFTSPKIQPLPSQPFDSKRSIPPLGSSRMPFSSYLDDFVSREWDTVRYLPNTARKHMLRPELLSPKGLTSEVSQQGGLRDEGCTATNPALHKLLGMVSLASFGSPMDAIADAAPLRRCASSPRTTFSQSPRTFSPSPRLLDCGGLYSNRAARSDLAVDRLSRRSSRPNPLLLSSPSPRLPRASI